MNFILIRINKKQIPQGGGRNNNWSLRLKRGSLLYRVSEIGHGSSTLLCYLQPFYLINYGVIQGFLALRKALTTHVKKYRIIPRVFDIANQLLTRHSPFAPLGRVDEWTAKPSRFSIQSHLTEFFSGSWLLKHWKIRIAYRQWHSNFPRKGGNQITERKTESYVFHGFGNGRLDDLPQSDFGRVSERLLLMVRTKSITESFVHWKLCQWFDFVVFQRIFSCWALASTHFTISFGDCRSVCFHSLIKLTFHCQQMAVVFIW